MQKAAELLGLTEYLNRKPRALSGGQRQRVAMGRAIVRQPKAFLMDEPLSNLDAKLRVQMRAEISQLQTDLGTTTVYVTHDQVEAMTMGDRVAVMRKGELQQVAAPQELYDRPVNLFVGGFIGSPAMNLVEATLEQRNGDLVAVLGANEIVLGPETRSARPGLQAYTGKTLVLGIRPEDLEDASLETEGTEQQRLKGKVTLTEALGSEVMVHFRIDAAPAATEDVRELAKDAGTEGLGELGGEGGAAMVGRFGARSRVRSGDRSRSPSIHARFISSSPRVGWVSTTGPKERKRTHDETAVHPARPARGGARISCGGLRRGRRRRWRRKCHHRRGDDRGEAVSGSINVLAVWTGAEGEAFQAVLDGFTEENPDVDVSYQSAADPATVLSTSVEGGNPPDVAALPSPGIMADFVGRDALTPLDFAQATIEDNYAEGWLTAGSVDGELYGVFFKGVNKSTVWYNVADLRGRRRRATRGLGRRSSRTPRRSPPAARPPTRSAAPTGGRSPICSRTSTCAWPGLRSTTSSRRTTSPGRTSPSPRRSPRWPRSSVTPTTSRAARAGRSRPTSPPRCTQVYSDPPKAAQVIEGDFVGRRDLRGDPAEPETGFNVYPFPTLDDNDEGAVVGAGDVVVMFKDSPAARALIEYLATPEAQEIWAERGGFTAPNKNVDPSVYPDEVTRGAAEGLSGSDFRFDLSDLQPAAFGSDAMFSILQDFLRNPDDVQGTADALEAAAAKAYG